MARFEASFFPGEDDRMPSWDVVEWCHNDGCGNRIGRKVESFYSATAEQDAKQLTKVLQESYNLEFYAEFG